MNNGKINELLIETYVNRREEFEGLFPAAVNRHRRPAIESFKLLGLPGRSVERYKYTNLESIFSRKQNDFELSFCGGESGKVWKSEDGVIQGDLSAFSHECGHLLDGFYNRLADNENDGPTALNTAFVSGGHAIYVPAGVQVAEPLTVQVKGWCDEEGRVIAGRRDLFVFHRNSRAKVIVRFDKRVGLVNRVCEIFLCQGAQVEIVELHTGKGGEGVCVNSVYVCQEKDTRYQSTVVALGGQVLRNSQTVRLAEKGAWCGLFGVTLTDGERHADHFTEIRHESPDAESYEHFKSIAGDKSRAVFNGRIYVAKDAQRTNSFQQSNGIVLSNTASIDAKPELEIYADDVRCSHGSTIGQLNEDEIFYMRQRGIGLEEARKLQITGFIGDILGRIEERSVRDEVQEQIEVLLEAR